MSYTVKLEKVYDEDEVEKISDVQLVFGHTLVPELSQVFEVGMCFDAETVVEELETFLEKIRYGKQNDCNKISCYVNDSGNSHVSIVYKFDEGIYKFQTGTNSGRVFGMTNFSLKYDAYPILEELLDVARTVALGN